MKKSALRRADLVFSLILALISILSMFYCIKLFFNPFGRDFAMVSGDDIKRTMQEWYLSPALVPFIFSACLLLCAAFLYRNARQEGARFDFLTKENVIIFIKNRETKVAVIEFAILAGYIKGLIPFFRAHLDIFPKFQGFPFMIATWLCLLTQMIIFGEKTMKKLLMALLISAIASAAVTYGFGVLAMIPLP